MNFDGKFGRHADFAVEHLAHGLLRAADLLREERLLAGVPDGAGDMGVLRCLGR